MNRHTMIIIIIVGVLLFLSYSSRNRRVSGISEKRYFKYIIPYDLHRYNNINKSLDELRTMKDMIFREKDFFAQKRLFDILLDKQFLLMQTIYSIENIVPPNLLLRLDRDTTRVHDITLDMIRDVEHLLYRAGGGGRFYTYISSAVPNNFSDIM